MAYSHCMGTGMGQGPGTGNGNDAFLYYPIFCSLHRYRDRDQRGMGPKPILPLGPVPSYRFLLFLVAFPVLHCLQYSPFPFPTPVSFPGLCSVYEPLPLLVPLFAFEIQRNKDDASSH